MNSSSCRMCSSSSTTRATGRMGAAVATPSEGGAVVHHRPAVLALDRDLGAAFQLEAEEAAGRVDEGLAAVAEFHFHPRAIHGLAQLDQVVGVLVGVHAAPGGHVDLV